MGEFYGREIREEEEIGHFSAEGSFREKEVEVKTQFVAFHGNDATVVMNGEIANEVAGLTWEKEYGFHTAGRVNGVLETVHFEEEPLAKYINSEPFDMLIYYATEHGVKRFEYFKKVVLTGAEGGVHVDDISQFVRFKFVAESMKALGNEQETAEDKIAFVLQNQGVRNRDVQMQVDAYLAILRFEFDQRQFVVLETADYLDLVEEDEEEPTPKTEAQRLFEQDSNGKAF